MPIEPVWPSKGTTGFLPRGYWSCLRLWEPTFLCRSMWSLRNAGSPRLWGRDIETCDSWGSATCWLDIHASHLVSWLLLLIDLRRGWSRLSCGRKLHHWFRWTGIFLASETLPIPKSFLPRILYRVAGERKFGSERVEEPGSQTKWNAAAAQMNPADQIPKILLDHWSEIQPLCF